jgi:HK97 family phage portal protein
MKLFGLQITRARQKHLPLSTVSGSGGWWPIVRESFTGAWQRNVTTTIEDVLAFHAVYACVSLIASDIGKLKIKLQQRDEQGILRDVHSAAFSPVLEKPNRYQVRNEFVESWLTSKLLNGNSYMLKARDNRQVVVAMHVLDPSRVRPMVAPDGSVFYSIGQDALSGVDAAQVMLPASEIIHDKMFTPYHPLCGISPIVACGLAAMQGLKAQSNSEQFFANGAQPSGILTAPGVINEETAKRIQAHWESEYSGQNYGRVAVLGDDLKYQPMTMSAVDAQLVEQLKMSAAMVCSAFRVPAYMVGVGEPPSYNNVQALSIQYYGQCLQALIEKVEALLNDGLGLSNAGYETKFDIDSLMRMDTASLVKAAGDSIGSGAVSPNEARARFFELGPVAGGDVPYLQQQNYSLAALAKRDALPDPFGTAAAPTPSAPAPEPSSDDDDVSDRDVEAWRLKSLALEATHASY